jgi:hypothetical protein
VQKGGLLEMSRKIRMRLLFDDWPAEDRKRWESAFKTGDRFDESGPGAHLAESTRRMWRESHARFLGQRRVGLTVGDYKAAIPLKAAPAPEWPYG